NDSHPAVHVAAVASLEHMENTSLTLAALDRLPRLAPTVQAYYAAMLLRSRPVVIEHLQKRLRRADDPALPRLAEFAARLGEPARGSRVDALRGSRPQRAPRGRSRPGSARARDGAAGPRTAGAGAGGVRRMSVLTSIVGVTDLTILVYFLVLNSFYAVLLMLS